MSEVKNFLPEQYLQTGMIKNNGIPQYLGVQTRSIQSYLQSASGFQGCLDGFGR